MPVPVDDLKINDWVVIIADKYVNKSDIEDWRKPFFSGCPFQIKSVALPFLAVRDIDGVRNTIDLRRYDINRVGVEFARAMYDGPPQEPQAEGQQQEPENQGNGPEIKVMSFDQLASMLLSKAPDMSQPRESNVCTAETKPCPMCDRPLNVSRTSTHFMYTCACGFRGEREVN